MQVYQNVTFYFISAPHVFWVIILIPKKLLLYKEDALKFLQCFKKYFQSYKRICDFAIF